jgi:hypothetical protein
MFIILGKKISLYVALMLANGANVWLNHDALKWFDPVALWYGNLSGPFYNSKKVLRELFLE